MIQLISATKRFGPQLLFEDLSWHIRRGERIGLVGANGAGKTTLLRILAGQEDADEGEVAISKGITLGLLDQEPDFSDNLSVLEEVERASPELHRVTAEMHELEKKLEGGDEEALKRYGDLRDRFEALGGYQAQADAKRVLCGLGFTEAELSDPASRFSGGWRMRIALARLLLAAPDVLLLDEPSNHLDLESLTWLEAQLADYEGAIVTVSHDRWFLDRTVKLIADLRADGISVYTGGYEAFVTQRDEELELLEKQKKQQDSEIAKTERFIDRFRAKNTKATAVQSRIKALDKVARIKLPPKIRAMRGFRFPQPGRSGRFVAQLDKVTKAYDDNVVYRELDLAIERGWKVALVGVNGAGKSTLLRILAGAVSVEGGEFKLGHNVECGYFAQHQLEALNTNATAMEEMATVADIETYPLIRGLLGAFLFSGDTVEKLVGVLSGGEKARLALAKMLLTPVALLLLDEPTSHLDLASRDSLEDALVRYEGTVVVVSHDRYFMNAICTHVLEVDRGHVSWYPGNYDDYLWKKSQEAKKDVVKVQKPAPKARSAGGSASSSSSGGGEKKRKRKEAKDRQHVHAATKQLVADEAALQEAIELAEKRLFKIDALLGESATYNEPGKAAELTKERADLERTLKDGYIEWEKIEEEIKAAAGAVLDN